MKAAIFICVVLSVLSVVYASHNKKHKAAVKVSEDTEWPHPNDIKEFGVPPHFTEDPPSPTQSPDDDNDETSTPSSGKHHGKSNLKSHSH